MPRGAAGGGAGGREKKKKVVVVCCVWAMSTQAGKIKALLFLAVMRSRDATVNRLWFQGWSLLFERGISPGNFFYREQRHETACRDRSLFNRLRRRAERYGLRARICYRRMALGD